MEAWMKEEPLEEIHGEVAEEDKIKCPNQKCQSTEIDIIETEEIHCLNCGSHVKRFKCLICGEIFGEVPL